MPYSTDTAAKAVWSALVGNMLIAILKFIGFLLGRSPSMLAESVHSVADVVNQVFLLIGLKQSTGGPSAEHNYGTWSARYLWNLLSAVGVFFIGCMVSLYSGFDSLAHPQAPQSGYRFFIALSVLVGAFIIDSYSLTVAAAEINRKKEDRSFSEYIRNGEDATVVAIYLEDLVSTLGVVAAVFGIVFSHILKTTTPDSLAAIFIGLLLGGIAVFLGKKNAKFLIGAAIDKDKEDEIKSFIERFPSVEKVVKIKTEVLSPEKIHISLEVEFHGAAFFDKEQMEKDIERIKSGYPIAPILVNNTERAIRLLGRVINDIERKIKAKYPEVVSIDLEVN